MSHFRQMTNVRENLRLKKKNNNVISEKRFSNNNANFRKLFQKILQNDEMSQKNEKKNNVINDHFTIKKT